MPEPKNTPQAHPRHQKRPAPPALAPVRLKMLFVIVDRRKAEFFADLLEGFSVNFIVSQQGQGTADSETLRLLGLSDSEKAVLLAVIREDRADEALAVLNEKFNTIKGGKGIAYTVPMTSVIGVSLFRFLADMEK